MDAGDLVPDEVTNAMVRDRLAEPDAEGGFLLDGFPRNVSQAYELDGILGDLGTTLGVVLDLNVDNDEVVRRLSGTAHVQEVRARLARRIRQAEGGRRLRPVWWRALPPRRRPPGDRPAPPRGLRRADPPLIEFYSGRKQLVEIDALGTVEDVTERAIGVLTPYTDA